MGKMGQTDKWVKVELAPDIYCEVNFESVGGLTDKQIQDIAVHKVRQAIKKKSVPIHSLSTSLALLNEARRGIR